MPAPPLTAARSAGLALAAGLGLVALLPASPAAAGLLDEPPRMESFKLDAAASDLPWLGAFQNAAIERPGPVRLYMSGAYGRWQERPWRSLAWSTGREVAGVAGEETAPAAGAEVAEGVPLAALRLPGPLELAPTVPTWLRRLDPTWSALDTTGPSLASNGFDTLWDPLKKPPPNWRCRRRPVQFVRHGGESARIPLVRCDGSIPPGSLDSLSIMIRPPEAPDPGGALPDEPDAAAWEGAMEWVPQIRIVHPRLLWALQRISDAFPWRTIYIFSGYRPRPAGAAASGHHGQHSAGRAMDIMVMGIPNAALFKLCRTLDDVGCGFYPNSKFVHVDVRRPGTGPAFWVDISGPGEPSRYVDAWPGVVERGAMAWNPRGARTTSPAPATLDVAPAPAPDAP